MPSGDFVKIGRLGGYYKISNYKKCDYLISNTPDIHRHVLESGWNPERAVMISNFGELPEAPDLRRSDFDTPPDRMLLLALGRLHSSKGFDLVMRALADLPECWLWVAGDGPEKEALMRLSHELGINDRVRFLGWRSDQAALFRAADVCVIPSRHEPLSNVVLESWSEGTPIVATRSEGPSWLITNEQDGLLVDIDDLPGITAAISRLAGSSELREKLARYGKEHWRNSFSKDVITSRYLDFILSIQARHQSVNIQRV
jgi:glycosyltransferase involved in cell wall biosynthesis